MQTFFPFYLNFELIFLIRDILRAISKEHKKYYTGFIYGIENQQQVALEGVLCTEWNIFGFIEKFSEKM